MKKFPVRLVLASLALCGIMAFLRWMETFHVVQGKDVVFQQLHDLGWDSYERKLTRTGSDPYAWFKLPPELLPVTEVSIDFDGAYVATEGTYYFFPSPADQAERVLGTQTTAKVEVYGTSFTIRCELPPSKALRLDLPDFLVRTVNIDRLAMRTQFWVWESWRVRLMALFGAICLGAALVGLVQIGRGRKVESNSR